MLYTILYHLFFINVGCLCTTLCNVFYNPFFIDYITETNNYLLALLPLHHEILYNEYAPYDMIGFCSYIAPKTVIVIYLFPPYRKQGRFLDLLNNYEGYICTNNLKMVKTLQSNGSVPIVNIPFFRLFYKTEETCELIHKTDITNYS